MNNMLTRTYSLSLGYFILAIVVSFASCSLSVRPVYNTDEQAKAERKVIEFHKLYNEENYQGIYQLLDEDAHQAINKEEFLAAAKQTFEKWGKVQNTSLSQAKVLPGPVIQVRIIYNVKFEKGDGEEGFIWNIRDDKARLLQYRNYEGSDKLDSQ